MTERTVPDGLWSLTIETSIHSEMVPYTSRTNACRSVGIKRFSDGPNNFLPLITNTDLLCSLYTKLL